MFEMAAFLLTKKEIKVIQPLEHAERPAMTSYSYLYDLRKQGDSGDDDHLIFIK